VSKDWVIQLQQLLQLLSLIYLGANLGAISELNITTLHYLLQTAFIGIGFGFFHTLSVITESIYKAIGIHKEKEEDQNDLIFTKGNQETIKFSEITIKD